MRKKMRPYFSATLGLFLLAAVGCSSSSSSSGSGAKPQSCTTAVGCPSGQVCISQNGSDFYCSPLCTSSSQCPAQQACAGATGSADAKCGNVGTYANGSGACSLFNGPYGPNTCETGSSSSSSSSGGSDAAGTAGTSPASGGAGGSSTGGAAANCAGIDSTDCTTCLSDACATESAACYADASCLPALTALLSCCSAGNATSTCESAFNSSAGSFAAAVTTCYQTNCLEKCSGAASGTSSGGAPGSGGTGTTVQTGWADAATCSSGAQNFYECCLLSGSTCSTLDQYTACCETKSCASGSILACMANHHGTDPTSCSSALTTCGD
ncbi:MAG TPA: hypothetical protein VK745_24030 [Polyangiaceae bacterium]|nr:hypothetical protein [Polyangiaceae bacterium]